MASPKAPAIEMPETPAGQDGAPFLSTSEVAEMLGISKGTVQALLDRHLLEGWRTRGGHRRITLASVRHYMQTQPQTTRLYPSRRKHRVSVVSDEPGRIEELRRHLQHWQLPVEVFLYDSMPEALLDLAGERIDTLLAELSMPLPHQEKTAHALQTYMRRNTSSLTVVLLTQEKSLLSSDPERKPGRLQVMYSELTPAWLQAFLTGVVANSSLAREHFSQSH